MTQSAAAEDGGAYASGTLGRLTGAIQYYDWGSHDFIARLQGRAFPSDQPEAELWFGAHPLAPATLERAGGHRVPLDQVITAAPTDEIGTHRQLPFLAKILAAARPLSIQVHPDEVQAARGFGAENERAIPLDDPRRSYRDPHAKPELVVALSPFQALAGFRPVDMLDGVIEVLASESWERLVDPIIRGGAALYPAAVAEIMFAANDAVRQLIDDVVAAADAQAPHAAFADDLATVANLGRQYPDDPGVPIAMLLQSHRLLEGDTLFIEPGCPHAYLQGAAVEVMAPSDNVVRAGLTSKHRDREGFLQVLRAVVHDSGANRLPFVGPFVVERHDVADAEGSAPVTLRAAGPEILLGVDGVVVVVDGDQRVQVPAGTAAWIPAAIEDYHLSGSGALVRVHP